ncbi:Gfo/Idh/MocA family oxidoreductase [Actinospica sp. MGRD01-02]|uniref:Gfo/Idh/MocA family oxidoreductase n=1 Tax=Actinospica acidithermotolerans TaxID=2828514 RepID=A0A941IHV6_9ACTN|nr:Gfo/Idh/MocA family oxidoreductase [Actinospica acidithermotolerans]MBR7825553.1 Gfo/Idh/MocA family oxidoreductase [Actinospica acidithermotolerans]
MSKPLLRAGLVGLGAMGRHHARVLRALDGVEFIGGADPGGDPYGALSGVPLLNDVESLIALEPDYVVVVCPTALHESVALQLAEAGIPALIEKPLAHDTPAAQRVVEAFESRGLVAAVGHIERYNPALQSLRSRLEAGELGEVFQVATRRQGPFPNRIADVGVVKDLATHDLDLTGFVTGAQYTSVAAKTAHRSGRPHEDLVTVLGELDSGVIANHLVNWLSPLKERVSIVTGEKGCFVADTLTADLTFFANGSTRTEWDAISVFRGVSEGDMTRYAIPKREPLVLEHETFRDAVEGKADAGIVTLRQGLRAVMVAEAVLDSARTGETLPLALA